MSISFNGEYERSPNIFSFDIMVAPNIESMVKQTCGHTMFLPVGFGGLFESREVDVAVLCSI